MAKNIKKLLSMVLAMIMVLSMIPAVSAAETEPEATEPAVTEPAATEPAVTEPAATEPAASEPEIEDTDDGIEWIEIANEEDWQSWFGNYRDSKLLTEYGDGTEVYFKLTDSFEITAEKLQYIGLNATGNYTTKTCKVTIDLNGQTLTYNKAATASAATRFMGIYGTADTYLTVKNGTIVNNGEFDGATGGIFFINKGTLNLENVTITDNSTNVYTSNGKLVGGGQKINLTGCTFNINIKNSTGKGGAVYISGGTANIIDCTFNAIDGEGSTMTSGGLLGIDGGTVTITGCEFNGGEAVNGGQVYIGGSTTTMTDCVFNGGEAEYGAQAYIGTILDTKGNVTSYGKATMNDCQFNGGKAPFGGAIAVAGKATLAMNGGTVANGVAESYTTVDAAGKETTTKAKGGNFWIYNEQSKNTAPIVTLTGVTVQDGFCDNIGGNIYVSAKNAYAGPKVTLENCTVSGGEGKNGGNFGFTAAADITINGGSIIDGTATGNGGQIWFWNDTSRSVSGKLNMTGVTLSGGEATGEGGAIYSHADKDRAAPVITLTDCTIENAVSAKIGGALYLYNMYTADEVVTLNNCTIRNCSADEGGALAVNRAGTFGVYGGTIEGCTATTGNGGAIYAYNGNRTDMGVKVTLKDLTIKDCTAVKYAGGVYMSNGVKYMPGEIIAENVTLDGNKSLGVADSEDSFFGGNVYIAGQTLTVETTDETTGETTKETFKNTATFTNSVIKNGVADGFGGNIGMAGAAQVTLIGCTVENGKTLGLIHPEKCGGGNVYMGNANSKLTLIDTDMIGGETALYGGNIRIGGGTIIVDQDSSIVGGFAAVTGHTIYLNGGASPKIYLYDGAIIASEIAVPVDETTEEQPEEEIIIPEAVVVNDSKLALINGTASGFDASLYTVYGKSYAVANEDGTYTIKHYAVDGATTKTGTCEEAGTVTIECAECGRTFVYEEAAAGHAIVIDKAVAPTCTETGLTEGQHCALCDQATVAQETIEATGHTPAEAVKENEVAHTCTTDGSYDSVVYCEVCKAELSRETGVVDPAAHTEKVVEGKAPSCTEDGLTDGKVCEICGETLLAQEPIPAAHTWDEGVYTDPTTEADGFTTFTCTVCNETKTEVDEGSKLPEVIPAAITKQPESVTAESGETVQFHVEAQGEVVSYKWEYRKISKWYNTSMTGYNTDTLTVAVTGARNGYDYRCIITFADGTVLTSEHGELTAITYITGVQNPNDQIVVNGFKGQFTAYAEGEGLKYRWYFQRPEGTIWSETAMEGCEKPTVYIESTAARNGYKYKCRITDVTGNVVYTEVAVMHVLSFTAHPEETFATTGSTVTMSVETSVQEGFKYEWYYSKNNGATWSTTTMEGYNTNTLHINTKGKNGYMYKCVLTGSKSSKIESRPATLHVGDAVVINAQTGSQTVAAADNAVFTVDATNVFSYQWMYSKTSGNVWAKTSAEGNQTNTLTVAAKGKNGYWYRCDMKGLDGNMYYTEVAVLTVQ